MRNDDLGDRQKWYEKQYSLFLTPLLPAICRLDGRAFHTFTRGLQRPFDSNFSSLMVATTKYMVESTGAKVGYCQSDEISLIWYEEDLKSEIFFAGNHSKMVSILAARTTNFFNKNLEKYLPQKVDYSPEFDARVWNVPTLWEATNYLIWRQMDATRNSVSMAAQAVCSHKELHEKSTKDKLEILTRKGISWDNYPEAFRYGTFVQKKTVEKAFTTEEIDKLPANHEARSNPNLVVKRKEVAVRPLPQLKLIGNREEVIFYVAEPINKA